jgi:hypothetical protein
MFETTQKAAPEPVTTYPESTAIKQKTSIWADETAGPTERLVFSAGRVIKAGERDLRVDTLRGLFLVVMMLDHLPYHPLMRFTSQAFGFVSAAEGFVFISGLVSAWVYGRILLKQGEAALLKRAGRRARDIYLTHVFLYTVALVGGLWGGWHMGHEVTGFWAAWCRGALLIYQPQLFGILPMYAVFLLLLPLLLQQMAKGRALLVCATSGLLWLAAQWGIGSAAYSPRWLQLGFFNILAWQLLFVAGVYFGYRRVQGLRSPIPASRLLAVACVVVVTTLFAVRHQGFFFQKHFLVDLDTALGAWRSSNHPLRLLNFAAYAYLLWFMPRSVDEGWHGLPVFRFLRYLSRHSLQVFAWSTFVSYVAFSFMNSWRSLPPGWQMILAVMTGLSLAIPAWAHERWKLMVLSNAAHPDAGAASLA